MRKKRKPYKRAPKHNFKINDNILVRQIRLVGENFEAISEIAGKTIESGIFNTQMALRWARELELDLVEISPKADPPVAKIIDFNKFLYQKKKKEKELKSKTAKTVIKEIRLGPNTDEHDFDFKLKNAKKFLTAGAKVKVFVLFRGRSIVFKDRGQLLLLRFINDCLLYTSPSPRD